MKIIIITINIYMICTNIYTQSHIKRMRDKQALMGMSRKWRIMYMQMRHIK